MRVEGNEAWRPREDRPGSLHSVLTGCWAFAQSSMPTTMGDIAQNFLHRPLQPITEVLRIGMAPVGPGLLPRCAFLWGRGNG